MSEVKWEVKKLGDFFNITSSKRVFKKDWTIKGVPFYRAREIVQLAKKGFVKNELFISDEMFNEYSEKFGFPKYNDIMVTGVGTLGVCYVVKEGDKFYFKDGNIIWLQSLGSINSRFVEYAFQSNHIRNQLEGSVGATVGTYTIIRAKNTKINVPSLPEQQRIVSLLDEAFESIDQAKANAEKNLENAKELFESYLQSVFETKGKGWEEKKLEEIAELMYGFTEKSKLEGDYRYIRITDIDSEGLLCPNGKVYVDKSEAHKSYILKNNDLVMARTGASFGDVMLYEDIEPSIFASYLIRITFKEQIDNKLYWYFAKSPLYWNQARSLATGSAQPQFNGNAVKQVVFRYPKSINTQQEIIQQLDNLSDEIKQIEINYQSRIEMLDELRKSILEKAFNGEL